ncbi:MAG: pyrimidine 5'-nucleotidase [Paracoccaceae bacterium]
MLLNEFSHVRAWVFDLDNTLYAPEAALFDQIEIKMTDWVMSTIGVSRPKADRLRKKYWHSYGTTLAGLMAEHGVDPGPYLDEVHDIDLSHLAKDPKLCAGINSLPGRKIVYTNGSGPYAQRVLEARGLTAAFDAVYGVEHADFIPKPQKEAFEKIFSSDGILATQAAMFEDDTRNLAAPHEMGMRTIHVAATAMPAEHIHHHTNDLTAFLSQLV